MPKKLRSSPKGKPVNFQLIPPDDAAEPYKLLNQARRKWHTDLGAAEIALAWRKNWKGDKDGHLILGQCRQASELQREFAAYDFVILLNREVWTSPEFSREKKLALLDHELCHAAPALDKHLEQRSDERGRKLWRMRRHDIEEFRAIVDRHGCYKRDLEEFARALLKHPQLALGGEQPETDGKSRAAGEASSEVRAQ